MARSRLFIVKLIDVTYAQLYNSFFDDPKPAMGYDGLLATGRPCSSRRWGRYTYPAFLVKRWQSRRRDVYSCEAKVF
jgi:hypothetical protein